MCLDEIRFGFNLIVFRNPSFYHYSSGFLE